MKKLGLLSFRIYAFDKTETLFILFAYCMSGTFLTLINKVAIESFQRPNLLLLIQNTIAVILLLLLCKFFKNTFGPLPSFTKTHAIIWFPLVVLFVLMLLSSLKALLYVSVPTMIVMRNLTTLVVSAFEFIFLKQRADKFSILSLLGMVLGAIIYSCHDFTFSTLGYFYLFINISATSAYQIYVKKVVQLPIFERIGSLSMSYFNNLLSLPVILILALIGKEFENLPTILDIAEILSAKLTKVIITSGILGVTLSISAFKLNKLITATSMMVANNANKFIMIAVSEVFLKSTLDVTATVGAIIVLIFGFLYSRSTKSSLKHISIILLYMFAMIICGIELKNKKFYETTTHSMFTVAELRNIHPGKNFSTILEKKTFGQRIYGTFIPHPSVTKFNHILTPGVYIGNVTKFGIPDNCKAQNASGWQICNTNNCRIANSAMRLNIPKKTVSGEDTEDFINRILEIAWGVNPPSIDLYVRSGCSDLKEIRYLIKSIELFWPRFLGSVVIVLDIGDQIILEHFLPKIPKHHYVIKFEYTPCFPGRVFNQYSYLNIDRHSDAQYVVTIDSDCVFHSPVTPDLIFRKGKVILPSSRTFQWSFWLESLNAILGPGIYDGQYMVSQPVTFHIETFKEFRKWFYKNHGMCYEDKIAILNPQHYPAFCWMCQLGSYLERGKPIQNEIDRYWFQHMDDSTLEPIMRYAAHISYEPINGDSCREPKCYEKSVDVLIKQGLCRAFTPFFDICLSFNNLNYLDELTFLYAHQEIQASNQSSRKNVLHSTLQRLRSVTMVVLDL